MCVAVQKGGECVCCWVVKDTLGAEYDTLVARVPPLSVFVCERERDRVYVASVARESDMVVCVYVPGWREGECVLPGS